MAVVCTPGLFSLWKHWQKEGTHCHAHISLLRGWIGALTCTFNDILSYSSNKKRKYIFYNLNKGVSGGCL